MRLVRHVSIGNQFRFETGRLVYRLNGGIFQTAWIVQSLIEYLNTKWQVDKTKFLYSEVSNPQDCSKCFTLYFAGRPVQSDTISTSLGSIQPYAAINARRLLISTTVYSQILLCTAE